MSAATPAAGSQLIATVADGFAALASFDQINLGASFIQASVLIGFALTVIGVQRVGRRPAMEALAGYWGCIGVGAVINMASSSAGALWHNRPLSLALTTIVVALHGAGVPLLRAAVQRLAGPVAALPLAASVRWGLATLVLHGGGVLLAAQLIPDQRIAVVIISRGIDLVMLLLPARDAWRAVQSAATFTRAKRAIAFGTTTFAARGVLDFLLGLRVGQPDLPAIVVFATILLSVLLVLLSGVFTLLAMASEDVMRLQQQADQLRESQLRLERAQRLESVGRLASGVAHDFANVLQAVQLSAESLAMRLGGSAPIELTEVKESTARGRSLARQLMMLGRPTEDAAQRFDVVAHCRELLPMLHRLAGGRPIPLMGVEGPAEISMDPSTFDQLIINLVVNAAHASPDGLPIEIELRHHMRGTSRGVQRCIQIAVRDQGTGIAPDVLPHIFEPFFTTKSRETGTGLGLSTVLSIAQRSGGDVEVQPNVPRGTCFTITLPLVETT
jgi:signal transduction histidine kinase